MAIFKVNVSRICLHETSVIADSEAEAKEIFFRNWYAGECYKDLYEDEFERFSVEKQVVDNG
jgi:hypothetical protein